MGEKAPRPAFATVEAAESLDGQTRQRLDVALARHVAPGGLERHGVTARDVGHRIDVEITTDHGGTLCEESLGDRSTDSGGSTGHERDLSGETVRHVRLSFPIEVRGR
jgi:hypothetical protein